MDKIKIFIGGSKEIQHERDMCRIVLSQLQTQYENVIFVVKSFEDFPASIIKDNVRQSDYNNYIKLESQIVIFIFDCKVGGISINELRIALRQLEETGHPHIIVFCKKIQDSTPVYKELSNLLNNFGHYYIDYKNDSDLKLLLNKHLSTEIQDFISKGLNMSQKEDTQIDLSFKINDEEFDDEFDLDFADGIQSLKDYRLSDALRSFIESFKNNNLKAEDFINKILFLNFGKLDWEDDIWKFFESRIDWKNSFAYLSYFYKNINNQENIELAKMYLQDAYKIDKRNAYIYLCDGICYKEGLGCKTDYRKASIRFEKAHKLGCIEALSYIAEEMLDKLNSKDAVDILIKGVEANDARCCLLLAKTKPQTINDIEVINLYIKAASLGMSLAWIELGNMYAKLWRSSDNWDIAMKYYTQALMSGEKDAHAYIAKLYLKREYYDHAVQEAQIGYSEGNALSASVLGSIYEEGIIDVLNTYERKIICDYDRAWYYYEKAYALGGRLEDAVAMARLYINHNLKTESVDWAKLELILKEAANKPSIEAISLLIKFFKSNNRETEASEYIRLGADSGSQALMYEYSNSAGLDSGIRLSYLEQSAEKGYEPSILKLIDIYKDQNNSKKYIQWLEKIATSPNVTSELIQEYSEALYSEGRTSDLWYYLYPLLDKVSDEELRITVSLLLAKYFVDGERIGQQYYDLNTDKTIDWPTDFINSIDHYKESLFIRDVNFYENYIALLNQLPDAEARTSDFLHSLQQSSDAKRWISDYLRLKLENLNHNSINENHLNKIICSAPTPFWRNLAQRLKTENSIHNLIPNGLNILIIGSNAGAIHSFLNNYNYNIISIKEYKELENVVNQIHLDIVFVEETILFEKEKLENIQILKQKFDFSIIIMSVCPTTNLQSKCDNSGFYLINKRSSRDFLKQTFENIIYNYKKKFDSSLIFRTLNILIVEDNTSNFLLLKILFEKELKIPIQIHHEQNGFEAWKYCQSQLPDIILADINMPIMDGFTFAKKIKSDMRFNFVPLIAITAYYFSNDPQITSLFNWSIQKPINIKRFIQIINISIDQIKNQGIITT